MFIIWLLCIAAWLHHLHPEQTFQLMDPSWSARPGSLVPNCHCEQLHGLVHPLFAYLGCAPKKNRRKVAAVILLI